ncbi:MAG: hypothetical protein WB767_13670 [Nocardioides sp.]
MDQFGIEYPTLRYFVIYTVQAVAFFTVAGFALSALRRGAFWPLAGAIAGLGAGLVNVLLAAAWGLFHFKDDDVVFTFINGRDWVRFAVDWGTPLGLALVAAAFGFSALVPAGSKIGRPRVPWR